MPTFSINGVARLIESFIDPTPLWTVAKVTDKRTFEKSETAGQVLPGQMRLLSRITAREKVVHIDPYLKQAWFEMAIDNAICCGNICVAKWLIKEYLPTGVVWKAIVSAVETVNHEFLKWIYTLHNDRVVWCRDVLRFLHSNNAEYVFEEEVFAMAKWLHEHVVPVDTSSIYGIVRAAAMRGDLVMLEWILKLDETATCNPDYIVRWAICFGHRNLLEWAIARFDTTWTEYHMDAAIAGGQLEIAQWLKEKGDSAVHAGAIEEAAEANEDATVKWALKNLIVPMPALEEIQKSLVVSLGRLDIIDHLLKIGVKFKPAVVDKAARKGRLDVVKWFHEHRIKFSTDAMDGAAEKNHLEVFQWLHANRKEGCTSKAMDKAAENAHLEILHWLHANVTEGCTFQAMDGAASNGYLAVVKWLHYHRKEGCTRAAADNAAGYGHLEVLKFLHKKRSNSLAGGVMLSAGANGHLNVVKCCTLLIVTRSLWI